jgi:hypothetical protein
MSNFQVAAWLSVMLVVSVVFIGIALVCVFLNAGETMHILQKIGFALLVFGLVVQCVRSLNYLQFGEYPEDVYFPLWITKDLGACVLIYYYSFIYPKVCNAKA